MTVIKQYNTNTSTWDTIVVGAQGAQGIQGIQGPTGPQGDWSAAETVNAQSSSVTSWTVSSSDVGKLITFSAATQITITVNTNIGIITGQRIDFAQLGDGQVVFSGGSATVLATPTAKFRAKWSSATLICLDSTTNTYLLAGDLAGF